MIIFESLEADRIIFHFNKANLTDPTIPMWTIKHRGQTYYVNHVTMEPGVGFKTKETPDNPHTKGSLQFKGRLKIWQEEDNSIQALIF